MNADSQGFTLALIKHNNQQASFILQCIILSNNILLYQYHAYLQYRSLEETRKTSAVYTDLDRCFGLADEVLFQSRDLLDCILPFDFPDAKTCFQVNQHRRYLVVLLFGYCSRSALANCGQKLLKRHSATSEKVHAQRNVTCRKRGSVRIMPMRTF